MKRLRNVSTETRFWQKVEKTDGCWKWVGYRNKKGYGILGRGYSYNKQLSTIASRISWEIHHGSIPDGLHVLHKCDNPQCTNPEHLFLGDNFDNQQDCIAKGRRAALKGSAHPQAKLTEEKVREMRHLYFAERRTQEELASYYGVRSNNVSFIVRKVSWKHV